MRITLSNSRDQLIVVDVKREMRIGELKALYGWETGMPKENLHLFHNGSSLCKDSADLRFYGISEGDVIMFKRMQKKRSRSAGGVLGLPGPSTASAPAPVERKPSSDPAQIKEILLSNPSHMAALKENNPNLHKALMSGKLDENVKEKKHSADPAQIRSILLSNQSHMAALKENNPILHKALVSGKLEEFARVLNNQLDEREKLERKRMKLLQAHPFDVEAQRLIAEEIRRQNIEANMEAALEHNPESFGVVTMLFINCLVNGHPVKAFVDSGAQTTIMSVKCAERVNIMRLVDTRWSGVARGVGVQRIIGRVHMVNVIIEKDYLTTSFSVIEEQAMDMLLGLDMLKRHQCCIDLKKNVLRIGTTGTETAFLTEAELPEFVQSPDRRLKNEKKRKAAEK